MFGITILDIEFKSRIFFLGEKEIEREQILDTNIIKKR
jgi:hypothetical protein